MTPPRGPSWNVRDPNAATRVACGQRRSRPSEKCVSAVREARPRCWGQHEMATPRGVLRSEVDDDGHDASDGQTAMEKARAVVTMREGKTAGAMATSPSVACRDWLTDGLPSEASLDRSSPVLRGRITTGGLTIWAWPSARPTPD